MATSPSYPQLERPAFFGGQRLLADDLSTVLEYQQEIRWLHNRTLHGWGIAMGLEVTGDAGDRLVTVGAGYALDCQGHDLILAEEVQLQVPPVSGAGASVEYYLTASFQEDADLEEAESRDGVCTPGGAVRRTELPLVRWQDPLTLTPASARYRPGLDLVLASVEVADCRIATAPDTSLRRGLAAPHRPVVCGGRTLPGATPWEYVTSGGVVGVQTWVDTSGAGFEASPAYLAQLGGSWQVAGALAAGWTHVTEAGPLGFRFQVLLPSGLEAAGQRLNPPSLAAADTLQALTTQARWHVHWVGIED